MDEIELYLNLLDEENMRMVAAELIKNSKFRLKGGFSATSCPLPMLKKSISESLKKNFKNFSQLLKNIYIDDSRYKNVFSNLSAENFMRIMYSNNEPSYKGLGLFLAFFPGEIVNYPWIIENINEGKHPFEFEWDNDNTEISENEMIILLMMQKDHDLVQGQMFIYIEKWGKRILVKHHALILEIKKLSWQEIVAKLRVYRQACVSEFEFFMVLILAKMNMTTTEMATQDIKIFQSILLLISEKFYRMTQRKRINTAQKIRNYRKNIRKKQKNIERQMISMEEKNINLKDKLEANNKIIQENIATIERLTAENLAKEQQIALCKQEAEKDKAIINGSKLYISPEIQNMIDDSAKEKTIILLSEENSPLFKWFFNDIMFMKNNERVNKIIAFLNNDALVKPIFINTLGISQNNLLKITNKLSNKNNNVFMIFANTPVECITEILKRL